MLLPRQNKFFFKKNLPEMVPASQRMQGGCRLLWASLRLRTFANCNGHPLLFFALKCGEARREVYRFLTPSWALPQLPVRWKTPFCCSSGGGTIATFSPPPPDTHKWSLKLSQRVLEWLRWMLAYDPAISFCWKSSARSSIWEWYTSTYSSNHPKDLLQHAIFLESMFLEQ